jgi:hypothetical protein
MRLKLDENLSRHLKQVLAALRHDVTTAGEENLLSQPDTVMGSALLSAQYWQRWQSLGRPWGQRAGAPLTGLLEIVA